MKDKRKKNKEVDVNLYVFSNPGDDAGTTELLQMFYRGAYTNSVGIMRALNTSTNKTETLLVGLEIQGGETQLLPLAKVLDPSEVSKYLSPDGKGGYFTNDSAQD